MKKMMNQNIVFLTISKSFLQINSDIFEEIYQKRKSLQLSSFESNDQAFKTSEINGTFQNISYIRNLNNNNNNYDAYSLKYPSASKKFFLGFSVGAMISER